MPFRDDDEFWFADTSDAGEKAKEISLGDDFGEVIVRVNRINVLVHGNASVETYPDATIEESGPANETAAKATHKIGAIERTGEHKGEIYGGIYPADRKPIWFSAAPKLMDYYAAATWAEGQDGSLPTREQGAYLTTLKGKGGAFTEIFNRGNSFPGGYVWLADPDTFGRDYAWCQRLCDGEQSNDIWNNELPVLGVFR